MFVLGFCVVFEMFVEVWVGVEGVVEGGFVVWGVVYLVVG